MIKMQSKIDQTRFRGLSLVFLKSNIHKPYPKGWDIFKSGYPVGGFFKGSEKFSGKFKGYENFPKNCKGYENYPENCKGYEIFNAFLFLLVKKIRGTKISKGFSIFPKNNIGV